MKKYLALILLIITVITLSACGSNVDISKIDFEEKSLIAIGNDIEDNELRAKEEYEGKYVSVSGELSTISENYFSVIEMNYPYSLQSAGFNIKSDTLREDLKKLNVDDIVTVKGKIIEVDSFGGDAEITMDAYEITKN